MTIKGGLLLALAVLTAAYVVYWLLSARTSRCASGNGSRPSWLLAAIGFVTNFFDTLGIGSFAPTTSIFELLDSATPQTRRDCANPTMSATRRDRMTVAYRVDVPALAAG